MTGLLLALTAMALLATKALDVVSTWQHVGVDGESNPIARRWFQRFGLARGLILASLVYGVILAIEIAWVWWLDRPWLTAGTVVIGLFVSWAQWDVARYNRNRRHSWFTRRVLAAYGAWQRWLERPRRALQRRPKRTSS